jgi:D-alanine--D-alanine ligase
MNKVRIGVLMGGMSVEREVSLNSGRTICDHLDNNRYEAVPLFQTHRNRLYILPWNFLYRGKIADFEHRLEQEAQSIAWDDLKTHIDFMYIAQHGRYAEDGCIQGLLEVLNIPYLGSKVFGSAVGMDKSMQKKLLAMHGIQTPQSITIMPGKCTVDEIITALAESDLAFPLIVKPAHEGSSFGVTAVYKQEELADAITKAMHVTPEEPQPVLLEEKIEGMEFTCVTLVDPETGNVLALPPTELTINAGHDVLDYEHKYMPGYAQKYTPARCSDASIKKIQETCLQVMKALQFSTISRIDGFLTNDGSVVIIDPNTLCGMSPSSFFFNQAAQLNMSHTDIINYLITSELKNYNLDLKVTTDMADNTSISAKKIRVGVLLGGTSNEKETSLNSGRNVCYKLSPQKYLVTPLFIDSKMELYPLNQKLLVHNTTSEIEYDLDRSTKITWASLPQQFDFIFIALHGGLGENGAVQGMLETLQIPYNGSSVLASALAMDKYATNSFLQSQGFAIPQNLLLAKAEWLADKEKTLQIITTRIPFPLVIKPHDDGCSVMVAKASNCRELQQALEDIFEHGKEYALVEEYIIGMELTVGVLGNNIVTALPPSQAVANNGILSIEEKFLPGAGENQTPAPLPMQDLDLIKATMENVYKTVGCAGYARIDCFYQSALQSRTQKERVIVLEINSLPALTPATCLFHQAAEIGIKPMELIDTIITLGFEKHTKKSICSAEQVETLHS